MSVLGISGGINRALNEVIRLKQSRVRVKSESKTLLNNVDLPNVTKEQHERIKEVWGDIHVNEKWFSYFNLFRDKEDIWSPYYVPADLHYGIIDMFYTNYQKCRVMEDKNFNSFLYGEVTQPKTILRSIHNNSIPGDSIYLDAEYHILEEKRFWKN